jgi:mRNA interferase MazF
MDTETVRLNITIPKDLAESLDHYAGPGKKSRFIALAIRNQNDKNNTFSGTVTVLPISSQAVQKVYPFEVALPKGSGNLPKNSKIKADQIRTLDKRRLIKPIGSLTDKEMLSAEKAVKIHLNFS